MKVSVNRRAMAQGIGLFVALSVAGCAGDPVGPVDVFMAIESRDCPVRGWALGSRQVVSVGVFCRSGALCDDANSLDVAVSGLGAWRVLRPGAAGGSDLVLEATGAGSSTMQFTATHASRQAMTFVMPVTEPAGIAFDRSYDQGDLSTTEVVVRRGRPSPLVVRLTDGANRWLCGRAPVTIDTSEGLRVTPTDSATTQGPREINEFLQLEATDGTREGTLQAHAGAFHASVTVRVLDP